MRKSMHGVPESLSTLGLCQELPEYGSNTRRGSIVWR